jgi:uncharacterized membrane protein YbhN (UPF0104 family)
VRRHVPAIGILISVLAVAGVVWWASKQDAPDLPDTTGQLLALGLAVALYALNTAIRAERWHQLLLGDGAKPKRVDSYALTVVGYTGNNVLPARAGDAVRVVLLAPRAQTTIRTVIGTLLAERLLDVAVIAALFVVVGYAILGNVSDGNLEILGAVTGAGLVACVIAFFVLRGNERVRGFLLPILSSTFNLRGGHGLAMLGLTILIWVVEAAVWMAVGASVDFTMDPIEGLYLVALSSIFSLIPSGPAYAGTQDSAAVIGIKAVGGSNALAVAYLLMLRFVLVVPITTLGFILLAARYGGISKLRARAPQPESA